jgi:hypothetical protein
MVIKKKEGALTAEEQHIVKALLEEGWRNQDIQARKSWAQRDNQQCPNNRCKARFRY